MGRARRPLSAARGAGDPPAARRAAEAPVASVAKALATLRAFVDGQARWGVRELAAALDEPPSTVHRVLAGLRADGFVRWDRAQQKYAVGFELLRLASAVTARDGLRQAALPILRELTRHSGESAWLAACDLERGRLAIVAEEASPHPARYAAPLGRDAPLTDSAAGIAVLAALDPAARAPLLEGLRGGAAAAVAAEIEAAARDGHAVLRAREVGAAVAVAAAVLDGGGLPVGALTIVVPLHRFGEGRAGILGALLRDAAARLSRALGARILGGASAGSWWDAVTLISEVLSREAPSLMLTPALGGGSRNLEDLARGEGAYALTTAASLHDARLGRGPFARRLDGLRAVMNLSELHLFVVARGAAAPRGADLPAALAQARVSPGEQGFSAAQLFEAVRAAAPARRGARGSVHYLDYPEGRRQLATGQVDMLFWLSGLGNGLLQELEDAGDTRLLAPDAALIARLAADNPGFRAGRIPRAAFPGWLGADIDTVAVPTVLACRADAPDDAVYTVARAIWRHRAELAQMSSVYGRIDASFAVEGLTVPLHPGAARFLAELGAVPPAPDPAPRRARARAR